MVKRKIDCESSRPIGISLRKGFRYFPDVPFGCYYGGRIVENSYRMGTFLKYVAKCNNIAWPIFASSFRSVKLHFIGELVENYGLLEGVEINKNPGRILGNLKMHQKR